MKINLGGDFDALTTEKKRWIKENFKPDQYRIGDGGFIFSADYYVEFTDESHSTLFLLKWC